MTRHKKIMLVIHLFILLFLLIGVCIFVAKSRLKARARATSQNPEIIFFYGEECPHCKNVERFIEDEKIDSLVKFEMKEVYHNNKNKLLLQKKAIDCNLDTSSIPVPLLWTEDKQCFIGDQDIIGFFASLTGKTVNEL